MFLHPQNKTYKDTWPTPTFVKVKTRTTKKAFLYFGKKLKKKLGKNLACGPILESYGTTLGDHNFFSFEGTIMVGV